MRSVTDSKFALCSLLVILAFGSSVPSYAQPSFEWVTKTEGYDPSHQPWDMAVQGNAVITTGHFDATIDFDYGPGVYSLSGRGMFATRWDTTGFLEWPAKIGNSFPDHSKGIAFDNQGNFYLAGYYSGFSDFDPGPGNAYMTSVNFQDGFLAKYGPVGNYMWAIGFAYRCEGIAVDDQGNAYVTGSFNGTSDFDPGPDSTKLTSVGDDDIFIAKYSSNGTFQWVRHIGGVARSTGNKITLDRSGNLYVTGHFRGTFNVNPDSPTDTLISKAQADYNIFITKMDTSGNFLWTSSFECTKASYSGDLISDGNGDLYVTGIFFDTVDLDLGPGRDIHVIKSNQNTFLAKYDGAGNYQWGFTTGRGASGRGAPDLALDSHENLYLTGYLQDTMDLDPGPDTALIFGPGKFQSGYFLAKYDPDGNYVWAAPFDVSDMSAMATDALGDVYLTGKMSGVDTMDFDFSSGTTLIIGDGSYDLFTAKYRSRTITDTQAVSICVGDSYTLGYKTYTKTGTYYRTYAVKPGLDSMVVLNLTVEGPDTSVTRPDPKSLQASDPSATYQWVDCDNGYSPISGATSQTFNPAVNGNYAVIVTESGCSDTSACYAVTSIGVDAGPAAILLTVYPNPAREQVHLSFYLPEATDATIRLYDYQGRAVFTKALGYAAGHQAVTVPVGHLPAGMYHVLLRTEYGSVARKVVVQR